MGRKLGSKNKKKRISDVQLEALVQKYKDGASTVALSSSFGVDASTISKWLKQAGVQLRAAGFRRGSAHHAWAGGRIQTSEGYVLCLVRPEDPFFSMGQTKADGCRYVLEHRLVMARYLGRPLRDDETVHHIDGDRTNNNPENLQLRQGRHGKGVALCCSDCGSYNIVSAPLEAAH